MMSLSEIENDAITEFMNVVVGNAASSSSQIVNEEVCLRVPVLSVYTAEEARIPADEAVWSRHGRRGWAFACP